MRRTLKWLALGSTVLALAAQWMPSAGSPAAPVMPAARPAAAGAPRAVLPAASAPVTNLFPVPQASTPTVVAPPPPPPTPVDDPLPFTVTGEWEAITEAGAEPATAASQPAGQAASQPATQDPSAGQRVVFLEANNREFLVCQQCSQPGADRPGSVLMGQYRLESVVQGQITFTRLSDDKRKTLEWVP